jgi:hypothetical protein
MLKKYYFSITLLAMLLIATIAIFYRFMVLNDYLVTYEIDCDPQTESCYEGCDNDECTEYYYYAYITREASVVNNLCGADITGCELGGYCQASETNCQIETCTGTECSNPDTTPNMDLE